MSRKNNHETEPDETRSPGKFNLASLICAEWMTSRVHSVRPRDSVAYATTLLEQHTINQLPVVDEGILVGIVTDRDLRHAVQSFAAAQKLGPLEQNRPRPEEIPVEAVMTRNVITLAPHSTVGNAALVMRRERIGGVPVVDGARLAGIITRSDILDAFLSCENFMRERADRVVPGKRHARSEEGKSHR